MNRKPESLLMGALILCYWIVSVTWLKGAQAYYWLRNKDKK